MWRYIETYTITYLQSQKLSYTHSSNDSKLLFKGMQWNRLYLSQNECYQKCKVDKRHYMKNKRLVELGQGVVYIV